ncbi:hypothetical protein BC827DRAFT_1236740 [Russula dissimulans]|nr:hypothetical protein BC827DRAFT_1236740 [Russula dissimulans]
MVVNVIHDINETHGFIGGYGDPTILIKLLTLVKYNLALYCKILYLALYCKILYLALYCNKL